MIALRRFLRRHFPRLAARLDLRNIDTAVSLPASVARQPEISVAWTLPEGFYIPPDFEPKRKSFRRIVSGNYMPQAVATGALRAAAACVSDRIDFEHERWLDDGGRLHEVAA